MVQDPWETLSPSSGRFKKWETGGDRVHGRVVERAVGKDLDGNPTPQLTVEDTETGESIIVNGSQALLRNRLLELRPELGDVVTIELTGIEKQGTRTLKVFEVSVEPAETF